MVIITISGKARAGKDSTASILKEKLEAKNKKVLIVHYADYLKFICQKYFGWDGNKDEKGRQILQYIGTDVVRKRKPDLWATVVLELLQSFSPDYDFALIPDTRFPNEVNKMKDNFDCISINVIRLKYENDLTPEQRLHPSETSLDGFKFDYVLESEDGLDNLQLSVDKFISAYNL